MKRILIVAIFALSLATTAWANCKISLTPLSVTMSGSRPLISGTINGRVVRFVADSGATFSLITSAEADELKLPLQLAPYGMRMRGIGGSITPSLTTVRKLDIDGVAIPNVQFLVGGGEAGQDSVGVLGQNFWHIADVEYDLADGVIRIARPSGCGNRPLAYWARTEPVSMIDLRSSPADSWLTYGYVQVNGVRMKALFDTGAAYSFLTFAAARRAGIDPNGPGTTAGGVILGLGRKMTSTRIAPVDLLQIGDEKIEHTRMRLGDVGLDEQDVILGADFFLSHHVYVANGQGKIYFTYNGGPVFALTPQLEKPAVLSSSPQASATPAPGAATPADASDLGRRGAAELGRLEFGPAIADLTRAHDLDPKEPLYLYQRALAFEQNHQPGLALSDLNAALTLAPGNTDAYILRAGIRMGTDNPAGALGDLAAASNLLPTQADARFTLAELYVGAEAFGPAAAQFDIWIRAHPDDGKLALALNGRCRAGGMGGQDLPAALRACDGAVRRGPKTAAFLDSRGLVRLRMGDLARAIADYDAALALNPKIAWSLYGRGLAELKLGDAAQGQADIAAAKTTDPKLAAQARRLGLTPGKEIPEGRHP